VPIFIKIDRCLTNIYYHTMTKNDAITMMKNSAMWKDITLNFEDWNEMSRNKNDDDANDKLHLLTDDAVVKADINFTEIIVKSYGVFEIMKEIADDYGDDEVICIIRDKEGEMRYKCLLYHILMNMLKEEFEEEMEDKEYSDSEEESDEEL
jgi:hypothetical protein